MMYTDTVRYWHFRYMYACLLNVWSQCLKKWRRTFKHFYKIIIKICVYKFWKRYTDGSKVRQWNLRLPCTHVRWRIRPWFHSYRWQRPCTQSPHHKPISWEATIVLMELPARSQDLNPIEHACDILQVCMSNKQQLWG
jgi:hypothetical protein